MNCSLADALFSHTGRLYLRLRLRKKELIERELTVKYEGHYRNAGLMLLFDLFMALAVVAVVSLVALMLYFTVI